MKFAVAIIVFGTLLSHNSAVHGRIYRRCELAHQLIAKYKFDRTYLSNWICLIEAESGLDTAKVNDYWPIYQSFGLFQINNKKWCRKGYVGGLCNARCESFIDNDIKNDVECAKFIFDHDGFNGWKGWIRNCKGKPLPNLNNCNLHF